MSSTTTPVEQTTTTTTTTTTSSKSEGGPLLPVDRQWIRKLLRKHGRSDDEPPIVLAPMVDQSDLPFRLLCRDYGVNLCYSPMVHAKLFMTNQSYRRKFTMEHLPACDRPLIAQICGSDVDNVVATAKLLEPYCDAIDLNCGCPQAIAKRGQYGAFLLEEPDRLLPVVKALLAAVRIPVTVKVRLLCKAVEEQTGDYKRGEVHDVAAETESPEQAYNNPDDDAENEENDHSPLLPPEFKASVEASLRLYRQLVDLGVHLLTVHGRTRHQKSKFMGSADWAAIRCVVDALGDRIPIFANGSISCAEDARQCLAQTGCDGIMSSEGLLEYPPLLQSLVVPQPGQVLPDPNVRVGRLTLARQYLDYARQYPPNKGGQGNGIKCVRVHIHRFFHADLQHHTEIGRRLRDTLMSTESLEEIMAVVDEIQAWHEKIGHDEQTEKLTWYGRYHERATKDKAASVMAKRVEQEKENNNIAQLDDEAAQCCAGVFGDDNGDY